MVVLTPVDGIAFARLDFCDGRTEEEELEIHIDIDGKFMILAIFCIFLSGGIYVCNKR